MRFREEDAPLLVLQQEVRALLGDHERGRVGVRRNHRWHHRRVDHAQAIDAVWRGVGIGVGLSCPDRAMAYCPSTMSAQGASISNMRRKTSPTSRYAGYAGSLCMAHFAPAVRMVLGSKARTQSPFFQRGRELRGWLSLRGAARLSSRSHGLDYGPAKCPLGDCLERTDFPDFRGQWHTHARSRRGQRAAHPFLSWLA